VSAQAESDAKIITARAPVPPSLPATTEPSRSEGGARLQSLAKSIAAGILTDSAARAKDSRVSNLSQACAQPATPAQRQAQSQPQQPQQTPHQSNLEAPSPPQAEGQAERLKSAQERRLSSLAPKGSCALRGLQVLACASYASTAIQPPFAARPVYHQALHSSLCCEYVYRPRLSTSKRPCLQLRSRGVGLLCESWRLALGCMFSCACFHVTAPGEAGPSQNGPSLGPLSRAGGGGKKEAGGQVHHCALLPVSNVAWLSRTTLINSPN